jgi:hypothetical protein
MAKDDYRSKSLFEGLDDKPQDDFVNETVEIISSQIEFINETVETLPSPAPKDDMGIKRKRGRPRKQCAILFGGSHFPAPKGEPSMKIKRGCPRNYNNKPSLASPSIVQGKLGNNGTRGRPRRHYSKPSMGSSYYSDNESESESDYEFVKSSRPYFPQGGYWVSSKRRREGNYRFTSSMALSHSPTASPSLSIGSSQHLSSYLTLSNTSIVASTLCSKRTPSRAVAATSQVVIYV